MDDKPSMDDDCSVTPKEMASGTKIESSEVETTKTTRTTKTTSTSTSSVSKDEEACCVIALEGLIGIGKSTLCAKMAYARPTEVGFYPEETNEKMLQLFYDDPQRYGFAFQWGMLKSRIFQLRLATHDASHFGHPSKPIMFWDRSMIGDYIFALWNHLLGGISVAEMAAYESEFGCSINDPTTFASLCSTKLIVWFNDEPSRCQTRVQVNRRNPSERNIPLSYYEGLDDVHFYVFLRLLRTNRCPILVQSWGEYDRAGDALDTYKSTIAYRHRRGSVFYLSSGVDKWGTRPSIVYEDEASIKDKYAQICTLDVCASSTKRHDADNVQGEEEEEEKDHGEKEYNGCVDVWIPTNIMQIDPALKKVVPSHAEPYNIVFYDNAYKRVVLHHLGRGHFINFYISGKPNRR